MYIADILADKEYDIDEKSIPDMAKRIGDLIERIIPREMKRNFESTEDDETILKCMTHNACRDSTVRRIRTVTKMRLKDETEKKTEAVKVGHESS